jgi:hypothetical protein
LLKYHKKKDVLDQKWYDEQEEPEEGWPKNFEYAKIKKLGGSPKADKRLRCIKKWRRPLSAEREFTGRQKKLLDLQTG